MTDTPFQAFRMNRVYIVIDARTKQPAAEPFQSMEGAEAEAARLNLQVWRESKPQSSLSEPLVFEDSGDLEDAILGIVDRMFGPERMEFAAAA